MDGAAGRPLPARGGRTSLELAATPHLDALAAAGLLGRARTVPEGMEPSSACACMSVLGYDPRVYYRGRAGIEARSLGVPVAPDEVVFRCNLVTLKEGRMASYSAGYIPTADARRIMATMEEKLGGETVHFYPGTSYRHILKLAGRPETLKAQCTPPHDIPDQAVAAYLPRGRGSRVLRELMARSEAVLSDHPVNRERLARGEVPATSIWIFWGSGRIPEMPPFQSVYGLSAAMTTGVDLLRGLARMMGMAVLDIKGVTDGPDNAYAAQAAGALSALSRYDLVVIHVEAPDEASHAGDAAEKIHAIEQIDREVIGRLRDYRGDRLRLLVMPDHLTPLELRTHSDEPVPFLLWGDGIAGNGGRRFTEAEAARTDIFLSSGYNIMNRLAGLKSAD